MTTWLKRLARFFQPGRLSDELKAQFEAEGVLYQAERIYITVHYRNFKAPGKFFWRKRTSGMGSLVLTSRRILGFVFSKPVINTPYDHPKFKAINFTTKKKYLSAAFDPSVFNPEQSGWIEIRFHLPDVMEAESILKRENIS